MIDSLQRSFITMIMTKELSDVILSIIEKDWLSNSTHI